MKDNTNKANEMIIYQTDCGMNTIDVYHLIQSQVGTINSQDRVIKLLEENAKLKEKLDRAWEELNYERNNHPTY
jgi:hypothetical protein